MDTSKERLCTGCQQVKPNEVFRVRGPSSRYTGKIYGRCMDCRRKDYVLRSRNPETFFRDMVKRSRNRKEISVNDLIALWKLQNKRCAITGLPMSMIRGAGYRYNNVSIDRIDSSKPYSHGNVWLVLDCVNRMKGSLSMPELIAFCRLIAQRDDNNLIPR